MHEVAESGEWSRDINRDVQGYMVLAMANYRLKEPSFARSTLVTGLAVAKDGLPADAAPLNDLPAWNDWIISHVLMDEAMLLIEGPAGPVGDAGSGEPRPDAHVEGSPAGALEEEPAAAITPPTPGDDVTSLRARNRNRWPRRQSLFITHCPPDSAWRAAVRPPGGNSRPAPRTVGT